MYTVGSVPYVNARPLVWRFENAPNSGLVKVVYDVPSRLPALLDSGEAHAVLASSIDAIMTPGRRIVEGVGIVSKGPVESVRLFSKVPFAEIKTLALDQSSLTSNSLARLLLIELEGVRPDVKPMPSDQQSMLAECDACVLIGDKGMAAPSARLHVLDLGSAWTRLTGFPFVWALWIGTERLDEELAGELIAAPNLGEEDRKKMISDTAAASGWEAEEVDRYLTQCIRFEVGASELMGFAEFARRLIGHGLIARAFSPTLVGASTEPLAL